MSALGLRADNPMNRALGMLLVFQAIVFGLSLPGMLLVDHRPTGLSIAVVVVAAVLAIAASSGLKKGWGHPLGWLVQAIGIALGAMTSMMYAVGVVFAIIWVTSFVLGRKIENKVADQ